MSPYGRRWVALFIVATCALFLPGSYTTADGQESAPAAGSSAEASPSPEPTPEPTPEPSPSVTPSEPDPTPSPAETTAEPSPSPDPSPSPTEGESSAGSQDAPRALGEESPLHLSLGAAPATIEIGEETTAGVVLTNPNETPAEDVDLIVTLPKELGFVSSHPRPDSVSVRGGKTTVAFTGLVVPASGSLTIAVIAEGLEETKTPATIAASALWEGSEPSETAGVNVVVPDSDLRVTTSGPGLLSTVGETVLYDITLRNAGDSPLANVSIVNLVPTEVHVTAAGLAPGIDAVQVGSSGSAEDIVWAITEMDAGEVVRVSYRGVVEEPGDLEALNRTRVLTSGAEAAEATERSYLAVAGGTGSDNPNFEPVIEKRVVMKKVVERPLVRRRLPTEPGGVPATAALPYSGIDPWGIAAVGLALMGLGALLVRFGNRGTDRRRVIAIALLSLLIGGACISSDPDAEGPGDTRVKGKEIERNSDAPGEGDGGPNTSPENGDDPPPADGSDGEGSGPETTGDGQDGGPIDTPPGDGGSGEEISGSEGDTSDDPPVVSEPPDAPSEEVLVPGPPVTTFERSVRTVTLSEEDLAVQDVSSINDADRAAFKWSDGGGVGGGSATSRHDALVEMTTSVVGAGEAMRATVTLENVSERTRVHAAGRFDLEISGSGGGVLATLRGARVDVVLNPGGGASADFIFRLPTGSYGATGVFRAD